MDQPVTSKIELKSRSLPALVGVIFVFQLFGAYKGWMILLVGLGGAWLLSYLWARSLANGFSITREKRYPWTKVGDEMLERFYLSNEGWAEALWVVVKDHSNLPGYQGDKVTNIGGHTIKSWLKRNYCNLRGLYTFGPTSIHTGDPFGIYDVTITVATTSTVLVLPPIISLPTINIAAGEREGEGRVQQYALERSVSSASIREYVHGDSLRSIHWPQSARRDELLVRVFDSTHSSDWWIILDMDEKVHFGEKESSTEEHSVLLASSLADRGRRLGRSVGLVADGEHVVWLPPNFGSSHHWEIMRSLALVKPGPDSLASVLARTQPALSQRTSVVVITPSVDGNWLDSLIGMMRRGIVVTVILLDPESFGGEGDAGLTLSSLASFGAAHYRITPDLIDIPEFLPDQEELRTTITALKDDFDIRSHARNGDLSKEDLVE